MSWVSTVVDRAIPRSAVVNARAAMRGHLFAGSDLLPVVVQGGLTSDAYMYRPLRAYLEKQGLPTFVTRLPMHGWAPAEQDAAALARTVDKALRRTGAPAVHLIGHSKGGIVSRIFLQKMHGLDVVESLTTLGTPHLGVEPLIGRAHAITGNRLLLPASVRQLIKGSDLLDELNADFPAFVQRAAEHKPNFRITTFSSEFRKGMGSDGVVPNWSSRLPDDNSVVTNVTASSPRHHNMLAWREPDVRSHYERQFGIRA